MSHALVALASLLILCAASPAVAADDIANQIIAIERAGLDGSDRGDVSAFLKLSVPDVVYFDPWQDKPMVGIENLTAYYAKVFKKEDKPTMAGEMVNTRVQVLGDTAVLTFNYIVRKIDTHAVVRRWNAVEVYTKRDGAWRIVNTNWAYTLGLPPKE